MNRNIYSLFVKSMFALLVLLTCNRSFAYNLYSSKDGDFNLPITWGSSGYTPSDLSPGDTAFITTGRSITINGNTSAPNLLIEPGATLNISALNGPITILINNKLIMKGSSTSSASIINFSSGSITLTVLDSLVGAVNSIINIYPPKGATQKIILKGKLNTLDNLINNLTAGGSSIVSYEGGDQKIFPSDNYATLLIGGTGVKTLSAESFNTGTTTTVSKRLHLNTLLKLGELDLVYNGGLDSLGYKDGISFNGWIWTDKTGMLKNASAANTQIFPVGDGTSMKAIKLSDIYTKNNPIFGVRYNASEPNILITPNGIGVWQIYSTNNSTPPTGNQATITVIDPIPKNQNLAVPTIAVSTDGTKLSSWRTPTTTQPNTTINNYQASVYLPETNNYLALFDCIPPTITPTTLPIGFSGIPYSSGNIQLGQDRAPYMVTLSNFTPKPNGLDITMLTTSTALEITGTPTTVANYEASFTVSDKYSCRTDFKYTIKVIAPLSPNLYINPIAAKTFGDPDFKISTYSKNTATPIKYTISPAGACVDTLPNNMLRITCAGPAPNNSITITATQEASGLYKKESVSTTFFINKAMPKLSVKNTGFLPNTTSQLITDKKSDGTLTFTQISGTDLATLTSDGQVTTFGNTGTFSAIVTIDSTNNYRAYDSLYVFTIFTTKQAPVAVNDTITIQMGQDTTLNLLVNDYGITDPINSTLTDIDLENTGIQKKYYSTSLGTFNIDPAGILAIHPFEGFIGTDKIAYTVTDEAGLTSNVAYLTITVEPPVKIPALKANEVMTPNNDGLNDALVIANTNLESENSLVITDETGNVVFEQDNYRNDWKGTNTKGNNLEAGVYFYVFTEKHSGRMLQNYLQIAGY